MRFGQRPFTFLNLPKACLQRPRLRDRLPNFVLSHYLHKLETRESEAKHLQIERSGVTESAGLANPSKKIFQIPTHYLESENSVCRGRCRNNAANVGSEGRFRIDPVVTRGACFILRQKILPGPARPPHLNQSISQQVAAGTRHCAQHVTAPLMRQKADEATHEN